VLVSPGCQRRGIEVSTEEEDASLGNNESTVTAQGQAVFGLQNSTGRWGITCKSDCGEEQDGGGRGSCLGIRSRPGQELPTAVGLGDQQTNYRRWAAWWSKSLTATPTTTITSARDRRRSTVNQTSTDRASQGRIHGPLSRENEL
jgi:hypothetical protein